MPYVRTAGKNYSYVLFKLDPAVESYHRGTTSLFTWRSGIHWSPVGLYLRLVHMNPSVLLRNDERDEILMDGPVYSFASCIRCERISKSYAETLVALCNLPLLQPGCKYIMGNVSLVIDEWRVTNKTKKILLDSLLEPTTTKDGLSPTLSPS